MKALFHPIRFPLILFLCLSLAFPPELVAQSLAADGKRTSVTELNGTVINWEYDALNRLVTEDYNVPGDANDFEHTYVYDLVGNRLEKQITGQPSTIYSYNDNDQLTSEITDGNSTTYGYDDNGSLTAVLCDNDANSYYTYNLQGRMASASDGTNAVTYRYNPDGIRIDANDGSILTKFLIDPFNHTGYEQVLKTDNGTNVTFYTIGSDVISQAVNTSDPTYLLYDGHGSVRHLANNTGAIVESYNYEAYGKLHNFTGTPQTNLLYAGEWYDSIATQYYLRARWYSPVTGRLNRMDDFSGDNYDPPSLHKYLYAHANPINNTDPTGNFTVTEVAIAVAIAAVLTNVGLTIYSGIRHKADASTIAYEVLNNIAVFGAITGAATLSGPLAVVAGGTLAVASVVGIVNLVRSWPDMDTRDKVVAAATVMTYIAYGAAIKSAVPPPGSLNGEVSVLPESYFSDVVVDMRNAPIRSGTTVKGVPRNAAYFWKQAYAVKPESFSPENLQAIKDGTSPTIDAQWIKCNPNHANFRGSKLVHHHLGQGTHAVALPEPVHQAWSRILHPFRKK